MIPERQEIIGNVKVAEYEWGRKMVVYIDNQDTDETFEQACERLKKTTQGKEIMSVDPKRVERVLGLPKWGTEQ